MKNKEKLEVAIKGHIEWIKLVGADPTTVMLLEEAERAVRVLRDLATQYVRGGKLVMITANDIPEYWQKALDILEE